MQVRAAIERRLADATHEPASTFAVRLPNRLAPDKTSVRASVFQRLAASRLFAYGDRAGSLSAAQRRSGRPFHLDVRQRVVVKALVSRHHGDGSARGTALGAHLRYLGRFGTGEDGTDTGFFSRRSDEFDATAATSSWPLDRHHFRLIVAPEHGDRLPDLKDYTRDVMARVADDLGEPTLDWIAICHFDTGHPHAHVLVRGRRGDGRDLVIPRDYIAYGLRARAQEVAQERLGDLSRHDAERRIWRETQADRFTAFDRRLLAAADLKGVVADGVGGQDTWLSLTRARLRHLERLGLAQRDGRCYRLAADMEPRLRRLQLSRDAIRTLNQRRLVSGLDVRQIERGQVRGRVVAAGFHDEVGASPWVVVRVDAGAEHYARLTPGETLPSAGRTITLSVDNRGVARIVSGRSIGGDLGR